MVSFGRFLACFVTGFRDEGHTTGVPSAARRCARIKTRIKTMRKREVARPVRQFAGYRDQVRSQMTIALPRAVVTTADGRACRCGADAGTWRSVQCGDGRQAGILSAGPIHRRHDCKRRRSVPERYGEEGPWWCCSIDRLTRRGRLDARGRATFRAEILALSCRSCVGWQRRERAFFLGRRCPTGVKIACLAPSVALR